MKQIRRTQVAIFIDYGNIRGSYGILTKMMGMYRQLKFQFSFKTLLTLADELSNKGQVGLRNKIKKGGELMNEYNMFQDTSSKIVLEGALNNITINEFVYFLTLMNREAFDIQITDSTVSRMIENAKKKGELKPKLLENGDKSTVYQGSTVDGEPLIHNYILLFKSEIG